MRQQNLVGSFTVQFLNKLVKPRKWLRTISIIQYKTTRFKINPRNYIELPQNRKLNQFSG